jgi:hypothetical protein
LLSALAACEARNRVADTEGKSAGATTPERAYSAPPAVTAATRLSGGRILLEGQAQPGTRIRLATPAGAAILDEANWQGRWLTRVPASSNLRLFGLSMTAGARTVQAEGYLAVTPRGVAAQLRAGAGARVLAVGGGTTRILAVDFDHQGGAVVSGTGHPGAPLIIKTDGGSRAQLRIDADGRFSMALNEPLTPGDHRLEAVDGDTAAVVTVPVSAAAALTDGPFRAARTPFGWRIDWMTPGGGVQTTLLITPREAVA